MIALLLAASVLAADGDVESLSGKVRVTGTGHRPTVSLKGDTVETRLAGELTAELQRLATFRVTVTGRPDGSVFRVMEYAIDDIGGGAKPVVGTLVKAEEGNYALRDGDGDAIPLSLRPMSKRRLSRKAGAKVWVFGKQLVSGEYAVKRYGVLREAKRLESTDSELTE